MGVLLLGAVIALVVAFNAPSPPAAATDETVVVLPDTAGRTGTVIVQRGSERQVLDQPYAASRIRGDNPPQAARSSAEEVRRTFGAALGALPARPTSFVLYFVTGKDELTEESLAELRKVLAELKQRPVLDVVVIGHADSLGGGQANDRLSLQRAERVKGYLTGIGIPAERIQTAGRGEREPLVRGAGNGGEARNRRVEINVR